VPLYPYHATNYNYYNLITFYRYANSKVKSQTRFPDMKCDDGTEVTGNKDKAELFNKFFSSMYTVEDMAHIPVLPPKECCQTLNMIEFTASDIQKPKAYLDEWQGFLQNKEKESCFLSV